jgi:two-component system response regulator HydG
MLAYEWRGNLRELLNVVKRTVLLSEGPLVLATDLPEEICNLPLKGTVPQVAGQDAQTLKEQHERQMIAEALARTRNNRTRAARLLGIDRKTLYNKMKLYNME